MDRVLLIGCKKGSVECVVDLPCVGEVELVCDRRKDFDDSKGFFILGGEFWVGNGAFKVSGF